MMIFCTVASFHTFFFILCRLYLLGKYLQKALNTGLVEDVNGLVSVTHSSIQFARKNLFQSSIKSTFAPLYQHSSLDIFLIEICSKNKQNRAIARISLKYYKQPEKECPIFNKHSKSCHKACK